MHKKTSKRKHAELGRGSSPSTKSLNLPKSLLNSPLGEVYDLACARRATRVQPTKGPRGRNDCFIQNTPSRPLPDLTQAFNTTTMLFRRAFGTFKDLSRGLDLVKGNFE